MSDSFEMTSAYTDGDIDTNPTSNSHLSDLIDRRYSRRETLRGGASAAAIAVFGGALLAACDDESDTDDDSAPVVTAGSSGTTSAGRLVTLTSTVTDDGGIVTSSWTQVSGPTVTLAGATTATATFVAPAVAAGTPLVFRYTATDQSGQASSADTTVTISPAQLGFTAVAKNRNDVVTVPTGYTLSVLARLGDPLTAATPAFANNGTDTDYGNRFGDHNDALYYYGLNAAGARDDASNIRGVLVVNHENITEQYMHANGQTGTGGGGVAIARPESEAIKEIEAHGVSVIEVIQAANGGWSYVQNSTFNRRITPNTPVTINGPARGSTLMRTAYSPAGTDGRGTINNCANGVTPWGTNLTCEENWSGYFRRPTATDNPRRTPKELVALARYGVSSTNGNYGWASVTPADSSSTLYRRWDAQATGASATADYRNEPNQYGWTVEVDPYDRTKAPRKRTALGRMNHEGAWPGNFVVGRRPAWYQGDDAQNEYLYKFVSATPWVAADATATDRLAMGDKYLDSGTLYVARFNPDGSGEWLPLVFGQGPLTAANTVYSYADQADVLTHARLAADAVGATRMDRPEWTAVSPTTGEMYLTLTNNSSRTAATADASNPRAYLDPPSTSRSNRNGHILRLREAGDTTEATTFTWDIYLFAAGSDLEAANINLSGLTADNDLSSPDGLWFGRPTNATGQVKPLLWVQTDDGAFTDVTNNQMLAAFPGRVGDGGTRTVTNTAADGTTRTVTTRIGAAPGTELRRFLVGPVGCEITGVDTTPDGRTLFVGVQHPGEGGNLTNITSRWPDTQGGTTPAATVRPRSAVIVVRKNDGGVVAL
ncbi:PhoX family protein [Sphingomonas qomolangmaensis]|uniref:PhoX family phosphatase n=1 Tax=Sphingomonas qomolangmaensis TaxID=2918765 RepID=A0ABY5LDT1_9SPHN|nr:alkaline phosphatase PhoX [Sphingomonas qomolangmaensis]UUL83944.1 PhoX family phosphatase [Sphingomonas qomolangmaensis]